jgi:hypothetical protein
VHLRPLETETREPANELFSELVIADGRGLGLAPAAKRRGSDAAAWRRLDVGARPLSAPPLIPTRRKWRPRALSLSTRAARLDSRHSTTTGGWT